MYFYKNTNRKIHIKYTRKAGRKVKRGNRGGAWTQAEITYSTKQSITNQGASVTKEAREQAGATQPSTPEV